MHIWQRIVEFHQNAGMMELLLLYGVALAVVVFVILQVLLVRGRRAGLKALETVQELAARLRTLSGDVDDLEHRVERRLDTRTGELDARMTRKMDQKGDLIQERVEQSRNALSESISRLEARVAGFHEEIESFRERLVEVDGRIPGLFNRLDEFRDTLASTFQAELGSVLSSFDTSMTAILTEMKAELQLGISRIESIEGMVSSRERAERALLSGPPRAEAAEAAEEPETGLADWEEGAGEPVAFDDETGAAVAGPTDEGPADYPAEMGEKDAELEAELYGDEVDLGDLEEEEPEQE